MKYVSGLVDMFNLGDATRVFSDTIFTHQGIEGTRTKVSCNVNVYSDTG